MIDTSKIPWFKIAIGATAVGFGLLVWKTHKTQPLGAFDMLKVIASESRTPEEYARRAEAWASGESSPPPMQRLTRAFKKVSPAKMQALILKARHARVHGSRARHERFVAQPDEDEDELGGLRGLPKDVEAITKRLNARVTKLDKTYRAEVMDKLWTGEISPEDFERKKAEHEAAVDEIDAILVPLTNPKPSKKAIEAARAFKK